MHWAPPCARMRGGACTPTGQHRSKRGATGAADRLFRGLGFAVCGEGELHLWRDLVRGLVDVGIREPGWRANAVAFAVDRLDRAEIVVLVCVT